MRLYLQCSHVHSVTAIQPFSPQGVFQLIRSSPISHLEMSGSGDMSALMLSCCKLLRPWETVPALTYVQLDNSAGTALGRVPLGRHIYSCLCATHWEADCFPGSPCLLHFRPHGDLFPSQPRGQSSGTPHYSVSHWSWHFFLIYSPKQLVLL